MKYYDGLKYPEIHQILGTSEGALKASYHIAVKKNIAIYKGKRINSNNQIKPRRIIFVELSVIN